MEEIGTGAVCLRTDGHRADIILNRPEKKNAMNEALLQDLHTAIEQVDANENIRVVTLLGNGSVFSAGMDLEMMYEHGKSGDTQVKELLDTVISQIESLSIPSVASLKGAALAGAFELTLPVDFRFLSQDAKYGLLEVKLGAFPFCGATQRLPRLVGLAQAKRIILTGDLVDPTEAKEMGLVHEVVAGRKETDDAAIALADQLATQSPLGMSYARELLNETFDAPEEKRLAREQELAEEVLSSADYREGFEAQIEDRTPEFTGN